MQPVCSRPPGADCGMRFRRLSAAPPRYVGILTGFFVPRGTPPAAETDGPAGAALLALAFSRIGAQCRLLTDDACRSACEAALSGAGLAGVPVDAVAPDEPLEPLIEAWRAFGIDWMIAIERCGLSADGHPRNMRGEDLSALYRAAGSGLYRRSLAHHRDRRRRQ